jgi:Fe2+ or Zn2+ uptake regulation protein
MPAISLATVYRTLDFLEAGGLIRRVSTTDSVSRYDANLDPHQHLACRLCGRIADLEDPSLATIGLEAVLPLGFRPETVEVRIVGICGDCGKQASRRRVASDG